MQAIPRAPLLLVHRAAGCLGLPAVSAVPRCQETHRSGQVSFLKRTGVVLETDSLSLLGELPFPRKYSWRAFSEQMHEAGTGRRRSLWRSRPALQRVIGAQHSFDRQLPDTSHLTRVHSCGEFAAVRSGVCLYAWQQHVQSGFCLYACMPGQQHGSTTARQHGRTSALGHSLGFIAVSAGVRSV